ncbi:hypothetical protein KKC13_03930 [bacterium]|nr:hypothetical protein [bacterium]MBU1957248.1 hypothetical protein [bacterium]
MLKQQIEIIAPFPPPYGGISNHVGRLVEFLKQKNIHYCIFNHGLLENQSENIISNKKKISWYISFLFRRTNNIVHFHQTLFGFQYFYWFLYSKFNRNNIVITLHNETILNQNFLLKKLNIIFLKNTKNKTLLTVSKKVNNFFMKNNLESIYLPAYVPAQENHKKRLNYTTYNIFCNVWKLVNKSYIEKYGIDLILDLLNVNTNSNIRLFMFIGSDDNIDIIYKEITKRNLKNLVEIKVNENLIDHFHYADLLIRANREDAYGVSIQEAHDCNVPSISSDVCNRPKGTYLFKNGLFEDLLKTFHKVINTDKNELLEEKETTNHHLKLIDIYKNLMEKTNETTNTKL